MDTKICSKCGVEKALCEFPKRKAAKDGHRNECKSCRDLYLSTYRKKNREVLLEKKKQHYRDNREHYLAYRKTYRKENREKVNKSDANYKRKRRSTDPAYRLASLVGNAVGKAIKKQGTTKGGKTFSALPYTPSDLVEHLERQFDDKMSWDNYGTYWDLDHIYPQSLLPYDSLDHPNFQKCWALGNLQPLEKMENIKKSNKVIE